MMNYDDFSDVYIYECPDCLDHFALDWEMDDFDEDKNKKFWCPYCKRKMTGIKSMEDC